MYYCVQNSPPLVFTLSQINPVHALSCYFFDPFTNIFPSTPRSFTWSLPSVFSTNIPVSIYLLPHTRYMPRPSHTLQFYHSSNIRHGIQLLEVVIMQFLTVLLPPSYVQMSSVAPCARTPSACVVPSV